MISCLYSTCRQRRVLRAALISLMALTGCQGSLRTWRRDDPSLRDLVVTPHPWDESSARDEATRQNNSRSNVPSRNQAAKSKGGRANPYRNQHPERPDYELPDDTDTAQADEEPVFEVEDATLRSMMANAEPEHRVYLIQMYKALQAKQQNRNQAAEYDQFDDAEEDLDAPDTAAALATNAPSRKNSAIKSHPAGQRNARNQAKQLNYHLDDRDTDSSYVEQATASSYAVERHEEVYAVQPASGTRPVQRPAGQPPVDALGNRLPGRGAHFTMRDDDRESAIDSEQLNDQHSSRQSAKNPASPKPQDVRAPRNPSGERVIVEAMADTGYSETIAALPPRKPNRRDQDTSNRWPDRAHSGAPQASDVDAHYTDPGPDEAPAVITASAESERHMPPDVQPATIRPLRKNPGQPASSNNTPTTPTTSEATAATSATEENWQELGEKLLQRLETEPVENTKVARLNRHVTKRMVYALLGHMDKALEPIPDLQLNEQEYFRHSIQALHHSIDPRGNPVLDRRWPLVLESHRTAGSHLSVSSRLEVKNAAFCSNVGGFGVITKFPTNRFRPNQELLLYCEVDNFESKETKGGYETTLRGSYNLVDSNGKRVEEVLLPEEADFCQRMRRDYFFAYHIYTPKNIAPGLYQLELTIEDVKGNKYGQTTLDLEISSQ